MKEQKKPKISIIMATYNREHFIRQALDSILNQSFHDWECLVIDDGSSDNTAANLEEYERADARIKYLERGANYKKGLPGCRNMGLDLAKGDYIQFFDDDDVIHPENLNTCFGLLDNTQWFFCRYDKRPFHETTELQEFSRPEEIEQRTIGRENLDEVVTGKLPFASCTVLWDRRCFDRIRFNEDLMYGEEWECYTRILAKAYEGISINQVLYYNRKHAASNTGEFWTKDEVRTRSYKRAALLIIESLETNKLLNEVLKKFFIRLGFMLRSPGILKKILSATGTGKFEKIKYLLGFKLYPVLRPLFQLKGKLLKI